MLGEHLDAASAGLRVGYDDASPFSREYKRRFGQPPMRDVERLREAARSAAPSLRAVGAGPATASGAILRRRLNEKRERLSPVIQDVELIDDRPRCCQS